MNHFILTILKGFDFKPCNVIRKLVLMNVVVCFNNVTLFDYLFKSKNVRYADKLFWKKLIKKTVHQLKTYYFWENSIFLNCTWCLCFINEFLRYRYIVSIGMVLYSVSHDRWDKPISRWFSNRERANFKKILRGP